MTGYQYSSPTNGRHLDVSYCDVPSHPVEQSCWDLYVVVWRGVCDMGSRTVARPGHRAAARSQTKLQHYYPTGAETEMPFWQNYPHVHRKFRCQWRSLHMTYLFQRVYVSLDKPANANLFFQCFVIEVDVIYRRFELNRLIHQNEGNTWIRQW